MKYTICCILAVVALGLVPGCKEKTTVEGQQGKLTLVEPDDLEITRGQTVRMTINIERGDDLKEEVSVRFNNLPDGLEVIDADKKIVAEEATFSIRAADDAPLIGGHQASVTVTAPGDEEISATQTFMVEISAAD